tara:strand:+ start:165 stop:392 length:228 start_codon:yes stop_codon:yes gene_type:complete
MCGMETYSFYLLLFLSIRKEIRNKRKKKSNRRRSNRRHQQTILFRINGNKTHGSYGMRSSFGAIKKRILRTGRNS